jgi:hypothetical protein
MRMKIRFKIIFLLSLILAGCSSLKYEMLHNPEWFDNDYLKVPEGYVMHYETGFNCIDPVWNYDFAWQPFHPYYPQYGWDNPDNIIIDDSLLILAVLKQPRTFFNPLTNDSVLIEESRSTIELSPYKSNLVPLTPPYFIAARIRQEDLAKQWPGFWLYNFDNTDAEIDIMEYWDCYKQEFTTNIHYDYKMYQKHHKIWFGYDWHIYAVEVTGTEVKFYFDNHLYRTALISINNPMYLILDNGISPNIPSYLEIDWLKIYDDGK